MRLMNLGLLEHGYPGLPGSHFTPQHALAEDEAALAGHMQQKEKKEASEW